MSIHEDLVEVIARTIHDNYCSTQLKAGRPGPSVVPWDVLPDDKRRANLAQAEDIGRKLSLIEATVAPITDNDGTVFRFTPEEIDLLAREEHQRWMDERQGIGYAFGEQRNDVALRHDDIRPYDELPADEQQKDIDAVLGIPGLLADVGLRIIRLQRGEARPVNPAG